MDLTAILMKAVRSQASDLHLKKGSPPLLRIDGQIQATKLPALTAEDTRSVACQILNPEKYAQFEKAGEIESSYFHEKAGYFRVSTYLEKGEVGIAFRIINTVIPNIRSLNLPEAAIGLVDADSGLILVTGPTGAGKSTTLAAMINYINERRHCHIITLEDPIEYIHVNKKSIITQREIGRDTRSFPDGLRSALRQDPDIIMIGEMRDLETMSIAITAAETGHLVLATLHTANGAQSIARIVDIFPPHQQRQIQIQLSNSLVGAISQRLLPLKNRQGRIVAAELLICTPAIRHLIRDGKNHQIYSSIQTGGRYGMQTMESSLQQLAKDGLIEETFLNGVD